MLNDVTITRIVNGKKIELWGMAYYIWCFHLPSLIRLQRALGRRTCAANTLLNGTIWFLGPILYETLVVSRPLYQYDIWYHRAHFEHGMEQSYPTITPSFYI